ncbi:MAG: helix-turn-helix domain-containing protein [Bacteroidales bacterium]|nr:helix-turn-helix domain-containing protein [Bacteroidales bacterium]
MNRIKELIPSANSFADELADVLDISTDSIYRRIRGETLLSINEIYKLCTHYNISFDLFTHQTKNIAFNYEPMGNFTGFRTYLTSILNDMLQIERSENKQIIYAAIDVPIFHHFNYPELSAFKMFYWMKAVVNAPSLIDKQFSVEHISPEFADLGKQIFEVYCKIPSVEIWTDETINGLIKQIEFYWDSGNFAKQEDALRVCEQAQNEIDTLSKQAEIGNKNVKLTGAEGNFSLYYSQIEIGNNCIYTKKADIESIYLSVHTFNKIISGNPGFVEDTKVWLDNLIKKSNLISGVSQIHRYKFFKRASDKLERLVNKITENK